ncbi:hypothetical protein Ancab_026912 [Ancistrocladus abbreviatus]
MEFLKRVRERKTTKAEEVGMGFIAPVAKGKEDDKKLKETPPEDDVCPICFGDFILPCRANCGHWFCGSCILQVWNHGSALQPCKCPMCCQQITTLTPEGSLHQMEEAEAKKVLKAVGRYNRIFVGGTNGLALKICEAPFLIGRMLREMTDPNEAELHLLRWRFFTMMIGLLYMLSPFNFIPQGVNVINVCNSSAVLMVGLLKLIGLVQRYCSARRVRQLAASDPFAAFSGESIS